MEISVSGAGLLVPVLLAPEPHHDREGWTLLADRYGTSIDIQSF
jgi:hypothetical protein